MNNRTTPIGLTAVTAHIDSLRTMGDGGCHYIIFLDAGNGQSTLTEYISDVLHDRRIRRFGGRDRFLEYSLDGTMAQLQQILTSIRCSAGYTNDFEGVIAMDISGMAGHVHETQAASFIRAVQDLSRHATMVFYAPSASSHNLGLLIGKIRSALDEVKLIRPDPYTPADLSGIIKQMLDDAGIDFENSRALDMCIQELIRSAGAVSIKDAKILYRRLMGCADYSAFRARLDPDHVYARYGTDTHSTKKEAI